MPRIEVRHVDLADQHSVFRYFKTPYNHERLHQALGDLSPDQYEAENAPASTA